MIIMNDNLKQNYEAELRVLTSTLSASSSPYGDWKHIKYSEYIQQGKEAPYTSLEMNDYYQEREAIRARINEIQKLLKLKEEA